MEVQGEETQEELELQEGHTVEQDANEHTLSSTELNAEDLPTSSADDQPQTADAPRARVLFMQACSKVRVQSGKETHRKRGLLGVIQMATEDREQRAAEGGLQSPNQGENEEHGGGEAIGQEVREGVPEISIDALRREFSVELSLLRAEMQVYTDRALRDLESRLLGPRTGSQRRFLLGKASSEQLFRATASNLEKKHKSLSVPSLLPGKNQALTQTIAATRPTARRTKSDSLTSLQEVCSERSESKDVSSRSLRQKKVGDMLPSTCPSLHHSKGVVCSPTNGGNTAVQRRRRTRDPAQ